MNEVDVMKRGEFDDDAAFHPAGEQSVGTEREQGDGGAGEEQLYMLLKVLTQLEARDYGIQM